MAMDGFSMFFSEHPEAIFALTLCAHAPPYYLMTQAGLIIGSSNHSSWSLRSWLLMKHCRPHKITRP